MIIIMEITVAVPSGDIHQQLVMFDLQFEHYMQTFSFILF